MFRNVFFSALLMMASAIALAHPMGNFSINHYSSILIERDQIAIRYIIDMAEIPTFQELYALDLNGDQKISMEEANRFSKDSALKFGKALNVRLNGKTLPLKLLGSKLQVRNGAGGLPTLFMLADYAIDSKFSARNAFEYSDHNFPERIGWKEIVLKSGKNVTILNSRAGYQDRSHQLTEYPPDPTISSPQETEAMIVFTTSGRTVAAALQSRTTNTEGSTVTQGSDRFTRLITQTQWTPQILFPSLLIAFSLGAMHALSPGHGKTILAGYLIGSRGTVYHALFLGIVVTMTHTIGVFTLGLITLYGSKYILPEKLYPWLSFFSGISIVVIGANLFRKRLRSAVHKHHTDEHHHHHHSHHGPSHLPVDRESGGISLKSLCTVGISGGALPCPSALVVLLSAISLHKVGFGLLLIVAFSLGLAVVLSSVGILLVYAAKFTKRFDHQNRWLARLPLASSLMITVLGAVIALKTFF